ncbi:MAG: acyltransferase family protein [Lachnospiraceae bacterium]|nr:acyltransferase family protein [Lachnospiraceae bacterium]
MNTSKRLDHLDMVKGIGIFLVVLGHMEDISTGTRVWISSFHMPLFFIVSGILMAVKNEPSRDLRESVAKRVRGIIIPYLWFSLSYFIIDIGNLKVVHNIDFRTFIVDIIDSATFYGMSVLWFLPALFLASVGFLFLKKKLPDRILSWLLIVIAVAAYLIRVQLAVPYMANEDSIPITSLFKIIYIFLRAAIAQCFVGYGYYAKVLFDRMHLSSRPALFAAGCILLVINVLLSNMNGCVDLRNIICNSLLLYFAGAFTGCFGMILIMKAVPPVKLITYFGKNSLIVMACHINYYFLYAGLRLAWVVDTFVKHAKHYVFIAVVVITVFVLSFVVIEVINRWFPFVIGKKRAGS